MLSMKGTRLILLISSILLLTISSGLLFYKNLFLLDSPGPGGKVDFEELRYTDLQLNTTVMSMRKNLSADQSILEDEITRIKELLNIISDVNRNTLELTNSLNKIHDYFDKKLKDTLAFEVALKDLRIAVDALNPGYNELKKNNLKFEVDKRDFYRECVVDALFYVTSTNRDNEARLQEDRKILGQILGFANAPNPVVQKYAMTIDTILKRGKEIDRLTEGFNKDNSIAAEMTIVGKYYKEYQDSKAHEGEIFLSMVFGAIVLYLICLIFILKKLT